MRKLELTRKMYKDIKKKDHQQMNDYFKKQMNDFLKNLYKLGFDDGLASASIDYDVLKKVLLEVKGIGVVKAEAVINRLKELDKE